jgi:FkbM family methyltransferase
MKNAVFRLRSKLGSARRAYRASVADPDSNLGDFVKGLFLRSPARPQSGASIDGAGDEGAVPPVLSDEHTAMRTRYTTRQGFILTDIISRKLGVDERFTILDGGAREALSDPRWQVFDPSRVRLFGFEPDTAEVENLNKEAADRGLDYQYFPGALWGTQTEVTFYENKSPGGGSCFPQNTDLTDRWKFQNQQDAFMSTDIFYPTGTQQWQTTTLDDWAEKRGGADIDFMKVNVQGAELEILRGGETLLPNVIGIMAEISFVESYKDRPFFSDIDSYLRAAGFEFFDMIGLHYMGRSASDVTASHLPGLYPLWGQLIEAHGVYFRDPIRCEQKGEDMSAFTLEKVLKLVAFAEVFGQVEYAFELLGWLEKHLQSKGNDKEASDIAELSANGRHLYTSLLN